MTTKIGDICFKTGTYESGGKTKNRYLRGGVLFQGDDGSYFGIIEGVPIASEGKFSVFEPRDDADRTKMPDPREQGEDRIPF